MKRSAPLKPGKPLQRGSGFKRAERVRLPVPAYCLTTTPNYAQCTMALPVPKLKPVRSEPYRRLVAARPCINCGIEGFSQHAHGNYGKGMGLKTCDLFGFPLCCARPGIAGCHAEHDQGGMDREERRRREHEWARATLQAILASGQYPAGLPVPEWAS